MASPCPTVPARRSSTLRTNFASRSSRKTRLCVATTDEGRTFAAKTVLRELCARSDRGRNRTPNLQVEIAEAQVALESQSSPSADFSILEGLWRPIYINAPDIDPLLSVENPLFGVLKSPIKLGGIFQEFSSPEVGIVKNIAKLGLENVLEDDGITVTVRSRYEVSGPRRISLQFLEGTVTDVKISPFVESLLAPALLPRGAFNHQLLLAIREFGLSVPIRKEDDPMRDTAGTLLTFLDDDMLILRQLDRDGSVIMNREDPDVIL